jgi:bifunctional non-homologous end joining protein LigD
VEGLDEYRRKRDLTVTPEPGGGRARTGSDGARTFVIHRHAARRLHYDLRLERNGALASWAVPKGLPLEVGARHLAVHVEDHPLEYGGFEGEIPAGQYGAGTVEIWDRGTYDLLEEKRDGGITVRLRGERLEGVWTLVPARLGGDAKNWLLIRKRDDGTAHGAAPAAPAERHLPMRATRAAAPPAGRGWSFEVRWEGERALVRLVGGDPVIWDAGGAELTERFPDLVRELRLALRTPDCVVDGVICALDGRGRPRRPAEGRSEPLVYLVVDLLELDGRALLELPLAERRERARAVVASGRAGVRLSEPFDDGPALLDAAREQGLNGVIAKREDSPYRPGSRSRDWLEVAAGEQARERSRLLIAGFTRGRGRRERLGALVLAERRDGELVWAGNCGAGLGDAEIERLRRLLRPLERKTAPFAVEPRMPRVRPEDVTWVRPRLECEVEHDGFSEDGRLRAASYAGLVEE